MCCCLSETNTVHIIELEVLAQVYACVHVSTSMHDGMLMIIIVIQLPKLCANILL